MKKLLISLSTLVMLICLAFALNISALAASYYEYEDNDSFANANYVTPGDTVWGKITDKQVYLDYDYYKIVAPANGKISLQFYHQYQNSTDSYNVTVYMYYNYEYVKISSTDIKLNKKEWVELPYIGAVKNGVYYVRVQGINGYLGNIFGKDYALKTGFAASNLYQKMINTSFGTATPMVPNYKYNGTTANYDHFYYKMTAPANGKITVDFCHNYEYNASGNGWSVDTYQYVNGSYNKISSSIIPINGNERVRVLTVNAVKGRTYYIKVYSGLDIAGKNYVLDTRFTLSPMTGVKAKTSTNSVKLTWNKSAGVSGYEIQKRSKNGKWSRIALTASASYQANKLKAGQKYTYAVRAYVTVNGVKYYSDWVVLTAVTKPGTPTLKVSAAKKSAKLTWNKQSASGYVIYRATSKNGKYKKIATVKSGKTTSYKNGKLKSGKTYYYKIRAYKTVNGEKVYGAYSNIKKVKIK